MKSNWKIPVAVVGAGNVARTAHLPVWKKIPEVELVALCDTNRKNLESAAKQWRIPYTYTDFDALIEQQKEGTIIDICTPPSTHKQFATRALEAGHHVVLEKPIAMSLDENAEIFNCYQKKATKLLVMHTFLFIPPMLELASIINKKGLKDSILGVDICSYGTPSDDMLANETHWCHSLPGGRFGEALIHPTYIAQNLIGKLEVRDVWAAKMGSYPWVKYDELHVALTSCSKFCNIYMSFNLPRGGFLNITVYTKQSIITLDGGNFAVISRGAFKGGQKFSKIVDSLSIISQTIKSTARNSFKVLLGRWKSGHETLLRGFVKSIIENVEEPYSPGEAYEATETFLRILEKLGRT